MMGIGLPEKKTARQLNPHGMIGLLYGAEGLGKSTLASHFLDPLFAALEPGLAGLEVYQAQSGGHPIRSWSWRLFCELVETLTTTDHGFRTVIVDTVDKLTELAVEEVKRKYRVEDLSGSARSAKMWGEVKSMLTSQIDRLCAAPAFGVIFISHERSDTVDASTGRVIGMMERPTGDTFERYSPSGGSGYRAVKARADWICRVAMDLRSGERVLQCQPSPTIVAKDRAGVLPASLPLDYAAFVDCFRRAFAAERSVQDEQSEAAA